MLHSTIRQLCIEFKDQLRKINEVVERLLYLESRGILLQEKKIQNAFYWQVKQLIM